MRAGVEVGNFFTNSDSDSGQIYRLRPTPTPTPTPTPQPCPASPRPTLESSRPTSASPPDYPGNISDPRITPAYPGTRHHPGLPQNHPGLPQHPGLPRQTDVRWRDKTRRDRRQSQRNNRMQRHALASTGPDKTDKEIQDKMSKEPWRKRESMNERRKGKKRVNVFQAI